MSGWSREKRLAFEEAFYQFLGQCRVNTKNYGMVSLGERLYHGQKVVITRILDALEADKHDIYVLKSRQLGITTISRAFSTFWLGMHKGMSGALVFDSTENRSLAREELVTMIKDLPQCLKFPAIKKDNRDGLTLANDSKILFKSAGVKKTKTSGTLGRSAGLSFSHGSELCSWDNDEGLISYRRSLSDINPDRLYIWESTARGFNSWHDMWVDARADSDHNECIFIGWWARDDQKIERGSRDWELYGKQPPSEEEQDKIAEVKRLYDFDISQEQLAWYRRLVDPAARDDNDADAGFEASALQKQEDPWTEEEAFQQTGSTFFANESLKDQSERWVSSKYKKYMFLGGVEFSDMKVYPAETTRNIELKVWEEPQPDGVYVLGVDPAYGENENNDRSSIQVLRCYADGIDQVAEYAYPMQITKHFAWIIAGLMSWYGNETNSEVHYILELNGPGNDVLKELRNLKFQLDNAYAPLAEQGVRDIFKNVRQFFYTRPDAVMSGTNTLHWKTSASNKVPIMEGLRSVVTNGQFHARSADLLQEMKTVTRDGDSIAAEGNLKDDRVLAAALAVHYWELKVRRQLIVSKRTREAEKVRRQHSIVDQVHLFNQNILASYMNGKKQTRMAQQRLAMKAAWRYGRR